MKFFYLRWYRHIHHLVMALEIWFFLWIFGSTDMIMSIPQNIPLLIVLLVLNCVLADWALKKSGLTELVESEILKIKEEIKKWEEEQKEKENQD